jgi:hypothetical protein
MNLYFLLGGVIASLVLGIGGYAYGRHDGRQIEQANQVRAEQLVRATSDAMQKTAAEAISKIDIVNRTIRSEVQREIVEKPVYRDCIASDDILRSINAAKTGTEPAGDSELPGASTVN